MSNFEINDYILRQEAKRLAEQAMAEVEQYGDYAADYLHQMIDGHEWVIHTYFSLLLCANCDTSAGEQYVEETGQQTSSISELAAVTAYATLLSAARDEFCKLI